MATTIKVSSELRDRINREARDVGLTASSNLQQADMLPIVLPVTTTDRGWPIHVLLRGQSLLPPRPSYAMTEQPRTVTRERLGERAGVVDGRTMREIELWLRDFLGFA
ncbi:type II toxin-antitoxin system PemK/MazF family toxin [Leucobacter massiliensis]|uniref:Growth inhibitor PemK n=1 Tax=Leucobacter massiliensis TaxID=1686285 RepID=A0A2S9QR47_9MICO|nr:type II toxin-antitoxin system PemK/MazF family toxin [Leucobacter massiliensis]PRI12042.1 hypothetical protein B4915_02965 [Leucobacter massiliensis]